MTTTTSLFKTIFLFLCTLCLVSCDKDEPVVFTPELIVQTAWEGTLDYKDYSETGDYDVLLTFNTDKEGKYTCYDLNGGEVETANFTYKINGNIISIDPTYSDYYLEGDWWIFENKKNKMVLKSNLNNENRSSTLILNKKY